MSMTPLSADDQTAVSLQSLTVSSPVDADMTRDISMTSTITGSTQDLSESSRTPSITYNQFFRTPLCNQVVRFLTVDDMDRLAHVKIDHDTGTTLATSWNFYRRMDDAWCRWFRTLNECVPDTAATDDRHRTSNSMLRYWRQARAQLQCLTHIYDVYQSADHSNEPDAYMWYRFWERMNELYRFDQRSQRLAKEWLIFYGHVERMANR